MSLAPRLEAIYRAERQRLFACAFAVLGEAESAEDAVHAAFERLLVRDIQPNNLRPYVFQAVRNAARDIQRKGVVLERTARRAAEIERPISESAASVESAEVEQLLQDALSRIDPLRREIIELHLRADLRFREIADLIELPLGTVTSHYRRGIDQLRKFLAEDETNEPCRTAHS